MSFVAVSKYSTIYVLFLLFTVTCSSNYVVIPRGFDFTRKGCSTLNSGPSGPLHPMKGPLTEHDCKVACAMLEDCHSIEWITTIAPEQKSSKCNLNAGNSRHPQYVQPCDRDNANETWSFSEKIHRHFLPNKTTGQPWRPIVLGFDGCSLVYRKFPPNYDTSREICQNECVKVKTCVSSGKSYERNNATCIMYTTRSWKDNVNWKFPCPLQYGGHNGLKSYDYFDYECSAWRYRSSELSPSGLDGTQNEFDYLVKKYNVKFVPNDFVNKNGQDV